MKSDINSVGIIGMGSFGKLAASLVPDDIELHTFDSSENNDQSFETVAQSDAVLLTVPLGSISDVLKRLQPQLKPTTVVIDVCSVKVAPSELLSKQLSNHPNLLITHPLFGPQTFSKTGQNQLIVTRSSGERAQIVLDFCQHTLGLEIVHMTAEQHDRHMANVHALTMFIARACADLDVASEPIRTPSFQKLVDLEKLDRAHSPALFDTIQNGNPFAKAARQKLLNKLSDIERELNK